MAKAAGAAGAGTAAVTGAAAGARHKEQLEAKMRVATEHLVRDDYVQAMKAFSSVLLLDPSNQEAGIGKVLALQRLKRPRGALRSCLISLDHCAGCEQLSALRDDLLKELGSDAEDVIAEAASAIREAAQDKKLNDEAHESPECDSEASTEAQDEEPGCPASRAKEIASGLKQHTLQSASLEVDAAWLASAASADYRAALKAELLSFYRDFYKATSNKSVGTSQYSVAEKNGLSIKGGHRHMPRPVHVDLPQDHKKPVGTLTPSELKAYDGRNVRLLLSVHGDLFDVSDRPDKYGPEGPYSSMAGHDITWALWSGYDADEEWDKCFDLLKARPKEERDRRFQGLMSWWAFFEQEYGSPVGRLDVYEKEWTLPAPPSVKELCTVM